MLFQRFAVNGQRGENGRRIVPGQVSTSILHHKIIVVHHSILLKELAERDLMLDERAVVAILQDRQRPSDPYTDTRLSSKTSNVPCPVQNLLLRTDSARIRKACHQI